MYTQTLMIDWLSQLFNNYFTRYLPYVVVFTSTLYNSSDSDLGWHLKYGEYFFRYAKILKENIFSTQMSGFQWFNSSWATDLLTYLTFNSFGFLGLSVLGALIITLTFYFFAKVAKLSFWHQAFVFPIILYLEEPLTAVSFRGHLLTLLFISFLYYIFEKYKNGNKRLLFAAIPLFIFWSNFHGEFILGLGLLAGLTALQMFKKRDFYLILIFTLSLLATLINPFGWGIYEESFRHFGNPLQQYIIEWLPFDTFSPLWWNLIAWGFILSLSLIVIIRRKKFRENLPFLGITTLLLLFSFWIRRYAWPMYLTSIPLVTYLFDSIRPKNKLILISLPLVIFIFYYFLIIFIKNPAYQLQVMSWDNYCYFYVKCSPKAAEYLLNNKPKGKLLSFYNWGGWLISQYPEVKPSIDGRMHLWQDENGYSAFEEYYPYEQNWKEVDKSDYDLVFMPPTKPIHKQMMELVGQKKWQILYQDKYASIFLRVERNGKAE